MEEEGGSMSPSSSMSDTSSARSVETGTKLFKERVEESLAGVLYDGTFFSELSFTEYANPGLHITGIGPVGLPLSPRDAEAIKKICKQSPFGRGSETVIDTSVRKTWELELNDFETRNPSWDSFLNGVARTTVENLGVSVSGRADRYKLLLYEEGAFFKPHTDSEKAPGMFGTLVICLPSEHTGGEVRLVHGGEERVLYTSHGSKFDLTALAWYSDVRHEVQPVTSGYRLVLTYNLIQPQELPRQAAATLDKHHRKFGDLLRTWKTEFSNLQKLVYPLDHKYSEASLSLQNLKGPDAAKGQFLSQTCSKNGVYWFLATMTKRASEYDDYYGQDDEENGLFLDCVVTPSGAKIDSFDPMGVDEGEMLVDDYYDDRSPDSEDEGEFTGNEATGATYRYHDTVLVLIPKEALFDQCASLVVRGPETLRPLFDLLRNDRMTSPEEETAALGQLLTTVLDSMQGYRDPSHTPQVSFRTIGHGPANGQSWLRFYEEIHDFCHAIGRTDAIEHTLRATIRKTHWWLSPYITSIVVKQIVKDGSAGSDMDWTKWFGDKLEQPTFKHLHETLAALTAFESRATLLPPPLKNSFSRWANTHLRKMALTITAYEPKHLKHLLDVVGTSLMSTSDQEDDIHVNHIVSIIPRGNSRDSILELVKNLIQRSEAPSSPPNSSLNATLQGLIKQHLSLFKVSTSDFGYKTIAIVPQWTQMGHRGTCPTKDVPVSPLWFVDILKELLSKSLDDEALRFVALGLPELPGAQDPFWKMWKLVLDFTDKMLTQLSCYRKQEVSLKASNFVFDVLHHCIVHLRETRPIKPRDWSRPFSGSCGCPPCYRLGLFARSPHQQFGRFSYNESIRRHLQSELPIGDYVCRTDKSGSPYTLIVTKTTRQYDKQKLSWDGDVALMRQHLDKMERDYSSWTKDVLGARFETVRELARTLSDPTNVPAGPAQSAPSATTIPPGYRNPATVTQGLPRTTTQSANPVQQTPTVPPVVPQSTQSRPPVPTSGPSPAPKRVKTSSESGQSFRNVRPDWSSSSSTNTRTTNLAVATPSPLAALQQPPSASVNHTAPTLSAAQPLKPLPSAVENSRSSLSTSVASASAHEVPPVAGVKRKAETEFVDLTGDASE